VGLHSDVPDGVRALQQAGYRLITLTNRCTAVAEKPKVLRFSSQLIVDGPRFMADAIALKDSPERQRSWRYSRSKV
jgi:hypothetical protein